MALYYKEVMPLKQSTDLVDDGFKMPYLHAEWQTVLFESVKVQNQQLTGFSQRSQVAIAIHVDGPPLQNL